MCNNQRFCKSHRRVTTAALRVYDLSKEYGDKHPKTQLALTFYVGWDKAMNKYQPVG